MTLPLPPLSYKVDADPSRGGSTSFAGLPALLEASRALGVSRDLSELGLYRSDPGRRERSWSEALLALLASGGQRLADIRTLREDVGLRHLLGEGALPDERRLGEFLARFHPEELGTGGRGGEAFLPKEPPPLQRLGRVNANLVGRVQRLSPSKVATLDWDTQCQEANKQDAYWTYKGFPGYQPGAIYWVEQGLVVSDQFRAGNVPSEFGVTEFVGDAIAGLPEDVERVEFRGDAAAYNWNLMRSFSRREAGKVLFAITADAGEPLREAVRAVPGDAWKKLYRRDEHGKLEWRGEHWAEVAYASKEDRSMKDEPLRYLAIRYPLRDRREGGLPGQAVLPLDRFDGESFRKRHRVVTTNREEPGDEVIRWHAARCGSIERVFRVMKYDQAATAMPSGKFGANAAWYRFNVLLFNLVQAMRTFLLPDELRGRDLKGIRFRLLRLAGRLVMGPSRVWSLRISPTSAALRWLPRIRRRIRQLAARVRALGAPAPSG